MARKLLDSRRKIETRLAQEDLIPFQLEAKTRGITQTALAREAILSYLDRLKIASAMKEQQTLSDQLHKSTNRLASLLAKSSIDINTVAFTFKYSASVASPITGMIMMSPP